MVENQIEFINNKRNWYINYLGLNLKIKNNSEIKFDIYSDSTYADAIAPNVTYHPIDFKVGAICSRCERVIKYVEIEICKKNKQNKRSSQKS